MRIPFESLVVLVLASVLVACVHVPLVYHPSEVCPETVGAPSVGVSPLLIDDAERGSPRIVTHEDRDGFAYRFADDGTDVVGGPTTPNRRWTYPIVGGANGSRCAWNLRGQMSYRRIVFAGFAVNMRDPKTPYDASRYAGITFMARRSARSTSQIKVKLLDGNTEPEGRVCTECYNNFAADIVVTERWTRFTLPFETLRQSPGWGEPRPESFDPSTLFGIVFQVSEEGAPFDIWIDDLAFLDGAAPAVTPAS